MAHGPAVHACENGTAIITGGSEYPPLTWREDNALVGSTIDIVTRILAEVGVKALPDKGGPWKRVLLWASQGKVDILLGVRHAAHHEADLFFIDPPLTPSVQGVFQAADKRFDYSSWKDLEGKTGSITLGTHFNTEFDAYMHEKLSVYPVPKIEQNFMKLKKGRVDYMLGPLVPTQLYLQQFGYQDSIINTAKPLMIIDEFVAVSRKSSCMKYVDHLQKRIADMVKSGEIEDTMEEYFLRWFEHISPTL